MESHGVVHNTMYDPVLNKTFSLTNPKDYTIEWFGQNPKVEPIWTTNQKVDEERRSAAQWPGSNVVFGNQTIIDVPYNHSTPFNEYIDTFIKLYTSEKEPINFGALYFDEPDHTGHLYGPNSPEMAQKLQELDGTLGYLIAQLQSHHLYDKLNLIISSDHGMDEVTKEKAIELSQYVDESLFDAYGSSACVNLFMKNSKFYELNLNTIRN